ncbi:MAG TPA: type II secretion system secretin GspD [Candidatus Binatia bacterium]|nr:type II secretion system secretin GspD [Candidatus Binatia bacterium]
MTKQILKPLVLAGALVCAASFRGDSVAQEEPSPNVAPESGSTSPPQSPSPRSAEPPPSTVPPDRRLLPPPAPGARPAAPSAPAPAGGMISLNFTRADLVEIIHIIAQHLRLTYTIDPEVKGTVTINSAEPLKSEDLLPIFHQILRMNGAVAVRSGNVYRIVPIKDGKSVARPAGQSREDSFALQIVPVRYFTVAEMKRLLTPFLMAGGEILDIPRGNFLIIVDLPSNIQRLVEIAELIDVQVFAGTRMEVYQPKVASAEELAQEMIKIMQSFAASVPQPESFTAQFIPLPRINQLLIISHSEAAWTYAKRWIERIDVVAEGPGRRIFIYPVENRKAADLADVLGQALGLPTTTARSSVQSLQSLHRATPGGTGTGFGTGGAGTGSRAISPFGSGTGMANPTSGIGSAFAAVPAPAQAAPPAPGVPTPLPVPGQPRPATPAVPGAKPEEQLRIVADPGTNSLIIYGTVQEFQNIRNILRELDAVPRQVLMDVLIAEVTLNNDESFGVDYQIGRGNTEIFGRTFDSRGSVLTGVLNSLAAANEAGISQFPGGISGVIGSSQTVRALISALQSDTRVRILSSPSVLATDNRPARIQVGSEEPIATGTITGAVGTVASSTTIQYRNTGRIVTIIPQVNSQGLVNLQILAEVSQRGANVPIGAAGDTFPSFDTRQAETTAVVQDGDTLAIGGIITENKTRDRSGIPYLMDIPVFGRFFGSTTDALRKTELIMLITPNVIRTRQESHVVTEEFKSRLSSVRNELERIRRERERELERQKKFTPPPPAIPGPSGQTPDGEPQADPMSFNHPSKQPAAPAARAAEIATLSSSDASRKIQKAPLRGTNEIRPLTALPKAAPVSADAKPDFRNFPEGSGAQSQQAKLTLFTTPEATNVPNGKPDESGAKTTATQQQIWAVQLGSYSKEAEARAFLTKLRDKGYKVNFVVGEVAGQPIYRVEISPLPTRNDAQALQKELATVHKIEPTLLLSRPADSNSAALVR